MNLSSRTKKPILVFIGLLIVLGLLIRWAQLEKIPDWLLVFVWTFIAIIAFSGLGLLLAILDDLVGQNEFIRELVELIKTIWGWIYVAIVILVAIGIILYLLHGG